MLHCLEDWDAAFGVEQGIVIIKRDRKPFRRGSVALFGLFPDIKPRAAFGFEGGVSGGGGGFSFGGDIFRRQIDIPPGHRRTGVSLFAEQCVDRHIHGAGDGIETGHLQSGTQFVIPHNGGGVFAIGKVHILIAGGAPGVVQHRLAKSDCSIGQFYFADFRVHPVRQFAGHVARGHGAIGQCDGGAPDVFDTKARLSAAGACGWLQPRQPCHGRGGGKGSGEQPVSAGKHRVMVTSAWRLSRNSFCLETV